MADTGKFHPCQLFAKLGLNSAANGSCCDHIALCGAVSYGILSVNVLNPELLSKISPNRDLTNVILGATVLGGSLYLNGKNHVSGIADHKQRLLFAVYGSSMVTLGSVLLWAMANAVLPDNPVLRTAAAVGSSVVLLKTGVAYVNAIENAVKKASK